jgi:glycosyltransferase involved in cell wall biosynthesis
MNDAPYISVIMPVYNSEHTLDQAVTSVLNQSFSDFELILIDDGSTDQSWPLIQLLSQKDCRIKIFKNQINMGLMQTLNRALPLAKSEVIARLDSDDEMLPRRLEIQYKYMQQNPELAVLGTQYSFMGRTLKHDIQFNLPTTFFDIQKQILIDNPICHSSVMFRKKIILELGGYRSEFKNSEDYDLWLRVSRKYQIENLAESLVRVRLSLGGNSIAHRQQMKNYFELAKMSFLSPDTPLKELLQAIEEKSKPDVEKNYLRQFYWQLFKSNLMLGNYADAARVTLLVLKNLFL